MAFVLAPVGDARPQFFTDQGAVLNGGLIYFYAAGTSTLQNTFTDYTGGTANANPVVLDADGRSANGIWFTQGLVYKIIAKDSAGVTLWTEDQVRGLNDVTATQDEWVATGLTPTYVSAVSFTLAGDQTTEFHEERRLKVTAAGATKYCTITGSVFTTLTTITVAGDALSNPTTAVSYSLIRANNPSVSSGMVYRKGTAVASAATCDIWNTEGDYLHITGSTGPITSFGTAPYTGAMKTLIFDSTPTLTYNATTLVLPGTANIVAAANDRAIVRADTTANMVVVAYIKANGKAVINTANTQPTRTTYTTGSGTYTTPANCTRIRVRGKGAGGGGAGSGSAPGAGADGANTTFGTLTGNKGVGAIAAAKGTGGSATNGDINVIGDDGGNASSTGTNVIGGIGGGGTAAGNGGPNTTAGNAAKANTGKGGGGAGTAGTASPGAGGGEGGYFDKMINAPAATYSYAVGAKGAGGTAGGSGLAGGDGADGYIDVEEYYD